MHILLYVRCIRVGLLSRMLLLLHFFRFRILLTRFLLFHWTKHTFHFHVKSNFIISLQSLSFSLPLPPPPPPGPSAASECYLAAIETALTGHINLQLCKSTLTHDCCAPAIINLPAVLSLASFCDAVFFWCDIKRGNVYVLHEASFRLHLNFSILLWWMPEN